MNASRTLCRADVRAVYDRIGRWQDTQTVYERPALDRLIARGNFDAAQSILEIGCGTGRLAERLLRDHCPPGACYIGVDLSPRMVAIARDRLSEYRGRAEVVQTGGAFSFDDPVDSRDRVVATYVLDLLSKDDIRAFLVEAHRVLEPDGRLCLAGLTLGESLLGRTVTRIWAAVHAVRPAWVGGCRPLRMRRIVESTGWTILHREVVRAWGVPSEVLVAVPA